MPQSVELTGIGKGFGGEEVLKGIDLSIRPGEFLSLVGMSGCGKSTLLRIIAGLESPDRGAVLINGQDVTDTDPSDRNLSMVFQSYALYPHMTVRENIATPLRMRQLPMRARLPLIGGLLAPRKKSAAIDRAVQDAAETLQITQLLDRRPSQLSGGQRQRVALARALVRDPAAFLMDEPLSNLDAKLRAHMRDELAALHRRLGATFIYVTHDQVEAMTMSDRIALMVGGRIEQLGTPDDLYERPATLTVARFIGTPTINLLPVEVNGTGHVTLFGRDAGLATHAGPGPALMGLRPEDLRPEDLRPAAPGQSPHVLPAHVLPAKVLRSELHGADRYVRLSLDGTDQQVTMRMHHGAQLGAGADGRITLAFDPARVHLFDADGLRADTRVAERVAA